ncbi:cytochrome c oxidase subunit 2A [Paenibacillus sp. PR3]|uniref:Cytochrome c oxidase subunit 2A n=1 Tax=Paenibacillus terricola TaxID=2763503 RepID=A0ABR8MVM1_9BACL|nr:cytochrome c oxidase subunit 2A [Paenibacillus terricola]MBD3919630.1 cytochrome c oxidase subunit 2A [Paenibacillus terricola]
MAEIRPQAKQKSGALTKAELDKKEPGLSGTFVSVLILGAFIAISWIGVFVLFIARN